MIGDWSVKIGDWLVKIGGWLEIGIEIGTAVPTLPPPLSQSEGLLFHAFAELKKNISLSLLSWKSVNVINGNIIYCYYLVYVINLPKTLTILHPVPKRLFG
jgi:hypothetical protein